MPEFFYRSLDVLLLGSLACAMAKAAAPDDTNSPIRIVRAGHGNLQGMKDNIMASVEACRVVKKPPPAAAKLPSDSILAALAVVEEEELFAGQMWAKHSTQRQYGADPARSCRLTLFVHRSAVVEKTCASRWSGQNALLGALMDLNGAPDQPIDVSEETLPDRSCSARGATHCRCAVHAPVGRRFREAARTGGRRNRRRPVTGHRRAAE